VRTGPRSITQFASSLVPEEEGGEEGEVESGIGEQEEVAAAVRALFARASVHLPATGVASI